MGDNSGVGLRPSYQKMHINILPLASLLNQYSGFGTIDVFAIADSLFHIGLDKPLKDGRMRTYIIIALKLYH